MRGFRAVAAVTGLALAFPAAGHAAGDAHGAASAPPDLMGMLFVFVLATFIGLLDSPLQELTGLMQSLLSELPGLVEARARQLEAA